MTAGTAAEVAFVLGALLLVVWLVCRGIDEYVAKRERALHAMHRFGEAFIREFERPLIGADPAERPIRTRLRASPERGRLEVLLAPNGPHRYPNLSDHAANLTYDVARVLATMNDRSFACGELSARGRWVVVRFQLQRNPQQAGSP
jgi:hypothetical protein